MNYLPVSLNIANRHVLIVGGGKAALEKLQLLSQFRCIVTVVSEELSDEMLQYSSFSHIRPFQLDDLEGVFIVYACNSDREVNRLIKQEANARGILVNTPDDPELCDFLSPAFFSDGPMTVAVSSGGTDVRKAIAWRNRIKTYLSNDEGLTP
ncbi:MAG: bifunctional precorrin-2 dehydrogenase/sirohydrochlorin ferrochelatase [Chlorobium sp.]|nr:bifunctional precorrin-2 dehydrogenase/sirohydrochlorin ferrochelatase [Chlorobium sp.]